MKLLHIDNSFFELTPTQAKNLSVDGCLPRAGYEKKADPAKLHNVTLSEKNGITWKAKASDAKAAWIKRTVVNGKQVWSLGLYFSPSFGK